MLIYITDSLGLGSGLISQKNDKLAIEQSPTLRHCLSELHKQIGK